MNWSPKFKLHYLRFSRELTQWFRDSQEIHISRPTMRTHRKSSDLAQINCLLHSWMGRRFGTWKQQLRTLQKFLLINFFFFVANWRIHLVCPKMTLKPDPLCQKFSKLLSMPKFLVSGLKASVTSLHQKFRTNEICQVAHFRLNSVVANWNLDNSLKRGSELEVTSAFAGFATIDFQSTSTIRFANLWVAQIANSIFSVVLRQF